MQTISKTDHPNRIDTGRGTIHMSADNFLDSQLIAAFKACIENHKINDVTLLQHLEKIDQDGRID